ncbi:MAG: tyrosine--tRNA ligase [Candidatus Bathyarchaeota archaeon]
MMNVEERLKKITRNTEEIITLNELREILRTKKHPKAYWGFEPSGLMHLGTGLVCGYKILDMVKSGFDFTIFLADWHAWINNKLGGNLEDIRFCGEYLIHGFSSIGLTPDKVKYVWASELLKNTDYWETVVKIAKKISVPRVTRCLPIMGRELNVQEIEAASLFYPCMQVADMFKLEVDCACSGLDQRKAHMLARDVAEKFSLKKPLSLHTHLLLGLSGPAEKMGTQFDENEAINLQISAKMSKSLPKSCIYVHDSPDEIREKIKDAYCPQKQVEDNPVLEVAKYIVFAKDEQLLVERSQKYGGSVEFLSYEDLKRTYADGKLHPLDLKNSVTEALIHILEPVRKHFEKKSELVERMAKIDISR